MTLEFILFMKASWRETLFSVFQIMSDTNQPVKQQKLVRIVLVDNFFVFSKLLLFVLLLLYFDLVHDVKA